MISLHLIKQGSLLFPFTFFDDKAEWESYIKEYPELLDQFAESPDARYSGGSTADVFAKAVEYIPRSLIPRPYQYLIAQKVIGLLTSQNKGRVLDYGAGAGNMGITFAHAGFKVDFVEVEGVITNFLKWRVKKHFLTSGVFSEKASLGADQYDFVSLLNVTEHLDRPMETLQKITTALSIGGYLLMICNTSGEGLDVVSPETLKNVIKPYILSKYQLIEDTDDMLYKKI